ncbi:MAG: fibronectin type III domain-containing protein, partial [Prevotellaceae bacterium]|nr:fibronectin type III domain-containing protein [Prevotellaceae bacterium]
MKKTTPILSLSLALLLIFGVGAINAQAQQVQRNVSPSFGENNPPTLSERASAPNLMDFGVSSLPAGHNDAFSGLNGGDTLPPLSRVIADNNLCPLADQCAYTLTGYDSYGDSWNNGHVTISQNGTQVGDYAVPDDGGYGHGNVPHVWAVMLCPNLPTTVTFTAGSYASEVSYSFVNPAGVVVAHKDAGSSSNITETFTAVCPNCLAPTPSISGTTDNQADINWAADPAVPEYDIQWKASSVSSWTGSGVQQALGVASSPYTITGLSAQTTYNVRIRSVCTPGGNIENEDFSTWTTVNLTTACGAVDISTMGTSSSTGSLPWNDNFSLYTDAY